MTEPEARALAEQVLSRATADHVEIAGGSYQRSVARYANNAITQNVHHTDRRLAVTAAFGQRVGTASTNDISDGSIGSLVARAEAAAKSGEPDTEYLPPPGPQTYPDIKGYYPATEAFPHAERAAAIAEALAPVREAGLRAAGSFATESGVSFRANSAGQFGITKGTEALFAQTVMTENGTGWAECVSPNIADVSAPAVSRAALDKARAASDPIDLEPGAYTVILEPAAFAGLTSIAAWTLDAKAAHEGRSCWTGREGTRVGVDGLNVRGVPGHPAVPGSPWIQQGLPAREIAWIENGVLRTLSYSRYWAQHTGHEVTGGPSNVVIAGTEATTDDLVAQVDRGLLVTRFWYIRFVDPMKLLVTGMTRDGLFLIEKGRITRGVRNFRFNDSPLRVFGAIRAFGKPRASALHGPQFLPPVIVDDFHFTSSTSF